MTKEQSTDLPDGVTVEESKAVDTFREETGFDPAAAAIKANALEADHELLRRKNKRYTAKAKTDPNAAYAFRSADEVK